MLGIGNVENSRTITQTHLHGKPSISGERTAKKHTIFLFAFPSPLPGTGVIRAVGGRGGSITCLISYIIASSSYHSLPVTSVSQVISSWGLEGFHLFPHSFRSTYLLSTYCVPGPVLEVGGKMMNTILQGS